VLVEPAAAGHGAEGVGDVAPAERITDAAVEQRDQNVQRILVVNDERGAEDVADGAGIVDALAQHLGQDRTAAVLLHPLPANLFQHAALTVDHLVAHPIGNCGREYPG